MQNALDTLVNFILGSKKAIAAWLAAALIAFLVQHGVVLPENTAQVFEALWQTLLVLVVTWLTRNRVGAVNRSK